MNQFTDAREAKEFLISRIVAEAKRENVPLSEVERKMLYFSETGWTLPDIMEVNDEFDREYDQPEYEKKVSRLARNATKHMRKENPEDFRAWMAAARKLKKEDHYISVMVDDAAGSTRSVSDKWKTTVLIVIAGCVLIFLTPTLEQYGFLRTPPGQRISIVDEKLNTSVGYVWLVSVILVLVGLAYSHFDPKRRVYKVFDRMMAIIYKSSRARNG
jgi:hypothetical protein